MPDAPQQPDRKLTGILLLVCVFVITTGYYLFHKPFTTETAMAIGTAIWRIFAVLLFVSLSGGLGKKLGVYPNESGLSATILQAGIGLGILSVLVLIVGSTIGINWITLFVLPVTATIALWKNVTGWIVMLFSTLKRILLNAGRFERIIAFFLGIIFLSTLIISLAPPFRYDALMYHLVLPQQYVTGGRITHIPWLVMTGMPQTSEMLYTLAIGWGGLPTAAVMGWAIGLLAVLGILGFFQNEDPRISHSGWIAAASLLAGETFAASLSWAYVDWTSLLFGVCALTALYKWLNSNLASYLTLSGIFAGLSFATKYTGGILMLCCLTAVLIFTLMKNEDGKSKFRGFCLFSAASLVFPAMWLVRNLLLTGNSVYPFFIPAAEMDAVRIGVYQGAASFGDWWEGLALPIRATIWGAESAEGYSVSIGPLLLSLALCNLARTNQASLAVKNALKLCLVMVLSAWFFWAAGNRLSGYLIQTRMYYALFPALAMLAGLGWEAISEKRIGNIRLSRLIGAMILLALGLSAITTAVNTIQSEALQVISGVKSESDFLDSNLGWYAPAMRKVQSLAPKGRTLFLYEPRGLACVPACDPDEILDRWKISKSETNQSKNAIQLWKQQGFDYILLNLSGMQYLEEGSDWHHPPQEVRALREVVKNLPVVETFGSSYQIYKLQ